MWLPIKKPRARVATKPEKEAEVVREVPQASPRTIARNVEINQSSVSRICDILTCVPINFIPTILPTLVQELKETSCPERLQ